MLCRLFILLACTSVLAASVQKTLFYHLAHTDTEREIIEKLEKHGHFCGQKQGEKWDEAYHNLVHRIEKHLAELLEKKQIYSFIGIIHTQLPLLELCHLSNSPFHRMLNSKGTLYMAYPHGGLDKRKPHEQETYLNLCKNYPNFVDTNVDMDYQASYLGRSYVFNSMEGWFVFATRDRCNQNHNARLGWEIWLGSYRNEKCSKRYMTVKDYMDKHGDQAILERVDN